MNKTNKYLFLLLLVGLFTQRAFAQVKVGNNPTSINSNSILEIESTNKGLLLPRVALSATNNAAPLSAHVAGMVVYNTATAGTLPNDVVPGYYYNDGTKWMLITFTDLADLDSDGGPVIDNTITTPPSNADQGDAYIVPSGATGAWAGQTNNIAEYDGLDVNGNPVWSFYTPVANEKRVVTEGPNAGNTYTFNGTTWVLSSSRPPTSPFWRLGGNFTNTLNNRIGTLNSRPLRLMTSGRDRMHIAANGNVSIRRFNGPANFNVNGTSLFVGGGPVNAQGLQLTWNSSALFGGTTAQGYSGFLNHRGTGPGGFTWAQTNDASTFVQLMRLNPTGLLIGGGLQDYPSQRLEVNGNIALSSTYNMGIMRNTVGLIRIGSNMPSLLGVSAPTFQGSFISFDSRSTKPAIEFHVKQPNSSAENEVMVINNNGNVGIGTVTPTERLQVSGGNIRIDNSASYIVSGAGGIGSAINSASILGLRSLTGIAIETASTERMRIDINGNVGIGTTAPTRKLDVFGDISNRGNYFINSADGNGAGTITTTNEATSNNGIAINSTRGGGKIVLQTAVAGVPTERMRITQAGDVGIGTNNPADVLDVRGASRFQNAAGTAYSQIIGGTVELNGQNTNSNAIIDFHASSDASQSDYSTRIIRTSGVNGNLDIWNLGSGSINMLTSGNVVIGSASSVSKLSVGGSIMLNGGGSANVQGTYIVWNDGNLGGSGRTGFLNHRGLGSGGFVFTGTNNNSTFNEYMRIESNGNVGIGTTSATQRLTVANGTSTGTYTTTGWVHSSDARLKTNVVKVNNALGLIEQLNGVYYNWINNAEAGRQIGFLAQDVQKVVPEVVTGTEGDITKGETLGMAYQNLVPILVEAIKDQQKQIEELKAKLESLEKK